MAVPGMRERNCGSLPTNRVFVMQFRLQPTGTAVGYEGRGEHLVSGQVVRFHALEEWLAVMRRVLAEVES